MQRAFDPNEEITVTLTRTAGQWNEFLSCIDNGPHRVVRPIFDAVVLQSQRQQLVEKEVEAPPPRSNSRKNARFSEYEPPAVASDG